MIIDYRVIKDMAKEEGLSIKDLLALAPKNDPFYVGRPSQIKAAQWFTDLWQRFGYGNNVHLRRVHYQAVSQDPPVAKPNGTPYENTINDWSYLCDAGKYARYLDLVSPTAFVDRRNPEAAIYTAWANKGDYNYTDPSPAYSTIDYNTDWDNYELPDIPDLDDIASEDMPDLPYFGVAGYDYGIQQDYHLEIWIEKSTMNDVILPLCRKYGVNLVTGAGEMSITSVVDFMRRVRRSERPARILYISDYDPAGLGMPISVARKIEYFQRKNGDGDLDIRLLTVALTSDQVREYSLPRVPVKDTDRRKENWERDHGQGQVELDALEALHPGKLAVIVETAILGYYDRNLVRKAQKERLKLESDLDDIHSDVQREHQADIDELETDYQTLRGDFEKTREKFAEMAQEIAPEVEAYRERLAAIVERGRKLYGDLSDDLKVICDLDVDDYPLPEPGLPEESDSVLYLSERDYIEQLEAYNAHRHNEN